MHLDTIIKPLIKEFPFFLITILCLGGEDWIRYILHSNYISVTDALYNISLIVLFSYALTCLVSLIGIISKIILYGILIFIAGIDIFLSMNFSTGISPQIFLLLAETNARESKEFLREFAFSSGTFLMIRQFFVYIFGALLLEYLWRKLNKFSILTSLLKSIIIAIVFATFIIGFISCRRYKDLFGISSSDNLSNWYNKKEYYPLDKISKLVYSVYALRLASNEVHEALKSTISSSAIPVVSGVKDSMNVVIVIGESYIKSHCQLYGYHLPTCPLLLKEKKNGNLFVFQDVISPFNGTSASIKNLFSCNSLSDNETWYTKPIFPTIFKKAGFNVTFWDNQKEDVTPAVVSLSLTSFIYNEEVCKLSYNNTNNWTDKYDGDFVKRTENLDFSSDKNLIIYHLMGQHVDAKERFPDNHSWNYFTCDSVHRDESYITKKKKKEIADYDNATRYNDYVLMQIINRFRNKNTVLVYFSDHGEEIYDYRDHKGRDLSSNIISYNYLKYQHEIPFMIWCSDVFKGKYPQTIDDIKKSLSKPFMLDNLPNILFHLGQIDTDYYKPTKDLLNSKYICGKRMVHDTDYDEIRKNNK